MCSTTCARRVENSSITSRGTPLRSASPLYGVSHSTPRRLGELAAQVGLVEVAGGEPVGLEDRLAVEGPPLAVARAAGHVGDDHVRVQVRLLRARGAVLVGGGDKALAVLARDAAGAAADDARLVLEVGERRLPGGGVRLVDRPPGLLVAERVQEADALRDGEDEVEAGDRAERLLLQPPLAARRVDLLDRDRSRLRMPASQVARR